MSENVCCACMCVCVYEREKEAETETLYFLFKNSEFFFCLFSIERKGMELGEFGGKEDLKGFRNLEIMIRIYL